MKLGIVKEVLPGETRVSMTPDLVKKLVEAGVEIVIETGAGLGAAHDDESYRAAGATVLDNRDQVWSEPDLVCGINPPVPEDAGKMKEGACLLSHLQPTSNPDLIRTLVDRKVTGLSFDQVPRITRAQKIDSLSAMGSIAGYKSVLLAADASDKYFPMMMTAAGTAKPAKAVHASGPVWPVCMAIATARRMGADVHGYDVRPEVKEQVESLGGKAIEFDFEIGSGEGGYAKEQTDEAKAQEAAGCHARTTWPRHGRGHHDRDDPGPARPEDHRRRHGQASMRTGSVIVDLAAGQRRQLQAHRRPARPLITTA
jgi:NAD(P) transhydrogenase subunit alpha